MPKSQTTFHLEIIPYIHLISKACIPLRNVSNLSFLCLLGFSAVQAGTILHLYLCKSLEIQVFPSLVQFTYIAPKTASLTGRSDKVTLRLKICGVPVSFEGVPAESGFCLLSNLQILLSCSSLLSALSSLKRWHVFSPKYFS